MAGGPLQTDSRNQHFVLGPTRNLPSVSYAIATYNNELTIRECLESIRNQEYPRDLVEVVVADGGSSDKTNEICRAAGARIVFNPAGTEKGFGGGKDLAIRAANNDVVIIVDADNVLGNEKYTRRLVLPFIDHRDVVLVAPIVTADLNWRAIERYAAYTYDPFDFDYVLSCEERTLRRAPAGADYVRLSPQPGEKVYVGNGTAVRRQVLLKAGGYDYDLETGLRMERLGKMFLCTGARLFHRNATSLKELIRKRIRAASHLAGTGPAGYARRPVFQSVVMRRDGVGRPSIFLQVLSNLSLTVPFAIAIRESRRRHDIAMMWHIVAAPLATLAYLVTFGSTRNGRELVRFTAFGS